ncbi:hypothetical protein CXB49_09930 [Chromobacterium sp. ATCC 53434]|uniref:patatin-like phospholipase family protein n=1 Tax=Chromobacterium TaxID=535 RepID=UPI000C7789D5|nr:patatin-like phospholipase family protein [Chromobacterium sp. ATCC 53434]AUH51107.1 hypothetical protein CXB49_09930 [Chromobacterium sp. ATCC 53434]
MTAIHIRHAALIVKAGARARQLLRDGLRPEQVAMLPGAAGGPKAVGITGLDQAVFGWLADAPRERELVGASIGGWRFACAMQDDPARALARLAERYTAESYHPGVTTGQITAQTRQMLRDILDDDALAAILAHPHYRLNLLLVQSRGLANRENKAALLSGLMLAAALNAVSRPLIRHSFSRVICHDARSRLRFAPRDAIPTRLQPLDAGNLETALMGTVAIPGVLHGVQLPEAPTAVYRDGGLTDYHIDFPFAHGDDIALYPHFTDRIVPGWFDKTLPWRRHSAANHANTVLLAPSREYLAALPGHGLPDRKDFRRYLGRDELRRRHWRAATAESERLGDAFREWLEKPGAVAVQAL